MLMTRRKRKERKEIEICLNNKPLIQVHNMKYLGIIFVSKFTFREYINYMAEKCTKAIFVLSKSAKLNWGLNMYYVFFQLLIKHAQLPWAILHAVGIQLGSISGDTVAIITRCRQSLIPFTILHR